MKAVLKCICAALTVGTLFLGSGCEGEKATPVPSPPVRSEPAPAVPKEAAPAETASRLPAQSGTEGEEPEPPPSEWTLTYVAGENGRLQGPADQSIADGGSGEAVTAVPAEGYHFAGWSDGSTENPRTDGPLTADLSFTAVFAPNRYALSYRAAEGGSIAEAPDQTVTHGRAGRPVTAVPAEGYHFVRWSDGSTENPRTDRRVTGDLSATAEFAVNRYTLSYFAGEHGRIEGASEQSVEHGGSGEAVTGVPAEDYHFAGWSDGSDSAVRTDSEVTSDLSVTAEFEVDTYVVGGSLSGLAEGNEVILRNNGEGELVLAENGGFSFPAELRRGETYDVQVISQPSGPNQTCTVSGAAGAVAREDVSDITVTCVTDTYSLGGTVFGLPEGNRIRLANGQGEVLTLDAEGNFTFAEPLEDGSLYEVAIQDLELKPGWFCRVENGAGILAGRNMTEVDVACFPEAKLEAKSGVGKIEVEWNADDFGDSLVNLCRSREEIPAAGFEACEKLQEGALTAAVRSPHAVRGMVYDVPYRFQIEIWHAGGRRTYSNVETAKAFAGINDTGIDWCADNNTNPSRGGSPGRREADCDRLGTEFLMQDAHYGRDAGNRAREVKKSGRGRAGFDFTKVCASGQLAGEGRCPPNPVPGSGKNNWACTLDNVTGLIWEMKTDSGLRSRHHTYAWGEEDGEASGRCPGGGCDTEAYVQTVNEGGLCGARNWRLPTRSELLSIVDNGAVNPAVDGDFFMDTQTESGYWSSSVYAGKGDSAWQVFFRHGEVLPRAKDDSAFIRLVRNRDFGVK